MLGKAKQQQEEDGKRKANQAVLDRVYGQALEQFEHEEGDEGQHHEQHAVLACAVGLRVDVDRFDQGHIQRIEHFGRLQVLLLRAGGQRRQLPACLEAVRIDASRARQEPAAKLRMRPIRRQLHHIAVGHRGDGERLRSTQHDFKSRGQPDPLALHQRRESGIQSRAFPMAANALGERRRTLIYGQRRRSHQSSDIGYRKAKVGLAQRPLRARAIRRQCRVEAGVQRGLQLVHAHFVQAPFANRGNQGPLHTQRRREENMAFRRAARAQHGLAQRVLVLVLHFIDVGHHQHRSRDCLRSGKAARHGSDSLLAIVLALADRAVDHPERNQQQDSKHPHDHGLEGQPSTGPANIVAMAGSGIDRWLRGSRHWLVPSAGGGAGAWTKHPMPG